MSEVVLMAAVAANGVIGREGKIPWSLPEDLRRFKALTSGHVVVMGRRTWESLSRRPLPERRNIVLSRRPGFTADGAEVCGSLEEALERCRGEAKVFLVGGASVYAAGLGVADVLELTWVGRCVEGDVRFPEVDFLDWVLTAQEDRFHPEFGRYSFMTYRRRRRG